MTKQIGEYQVTTGTAILKSLGETERKPVTFVRWLPDEFHNGDMLYFGCEFLEKMDDEEEISDTLGCEWEQTTSWYGDLETFEEDA